ncbi:MAG: penicillin acylase family protein [Oceanicoccus sp.]
MKLAYLAITVIVLAACTNESPEEPAAHTVKKEQPTFATEIRWTSYGIPHVKAKDWGSLGYGFSYATAEDAICVIAKDVMMVNGEKSLYLGTEEDNLESDIFYKTILNDSLLDSFHALQSDNSLLFSKGYVKGYNRYLKDNREKLPASCLGKKWLRDISEADVMRLNIGVGIRYGVGRYMKNMADAKPPGQQLTIRAADFSGFDGIGSNAVALGSEVTRSARGLLFGNPHYPWSGSSRFHMIHTTIPGEVDVMGAGLMTMSRIAIGFNKDVAWTHTVSTALRATLYELTLNPNNPMQYLYGDDYRDIEPLNITVEVLDEKGSVTQETHQVYQSHYGPIVMSTELPWDKQHAYAVRDANVYNSQSAITYDALHKAKTVDDVEAAISHQGISFTNTIAADRDGHALYADISVTANIDKTILDNCKVDIEGVPGRMVVLNGSKVDCEWKSDARAKIKNTLPAEEMPRLKRQDYVTNSNDSYWLSNPSEPLEGYSPIIGPEKTARTLRTRAGITLVESLIANGKVGPSDIQAMLYAQRNFGAELLLDDVLNICDLSQNEMAADITRSCAVLRSWDRRQTIESRGAQVWTEFWRNVRETPNLYQYAFDANDPVNTPRGIALSRPEVKTAVHQALVEAQNTLDDAGVALDSPWGEVQFSEKNGQRIPIPGGQGWAGMFSMIVADLEKGKGYTPIKHGNSYIQVISWDKAGKLDARGILTYSQSQEQDSDHFSDQTELYSQGKWLKLPFTEQEIQSDPNLKILHLQE